MNILFICGTPPAECDTGGKQRTHNLYEALRRIGDVYTYVLGRGPLECSGKYATGRTLPPGLFKFAVDFAANRLLHLVAPDAPSYYPFPRKVDRKVVFPGVKFDIVVMRYVYSAGVLHPWRIAPTWIDVDDHPLQTHDTLAAAGYGFLRRWMSRRLVAWTTSMSLRRCAGCWVANPGQIAWLGEARAAWPLRNISLEVPVGYDADARRERVLMSVGCMAYEPNYLGVDRFLSDIWPSVRARHPDLSYRVAGGGLPPEYADKWKRVPGVSYLGRVEDISAEYSKAIASVVPVHAGGGTCIKTIESLAHSRVCLSTPFGARGVVDPGGEDGRSGILVYEDRDGFARALDRILQDDERARLERNARAYYLENFSFEKFRRECADAIAGREGGSRPCAEKAGDGRLHEG